MKRTAAAFVLVAGLGGGCTTTDHQSEPKIVYPSGGPSAQYMGAHGEPVQSPMYSRGQKPPVVRADARNLPKGGVIPASAAERGYSDKTGMMAKGGPVPMGDDGVPGFYLSRGILPVPAMGPYGAVAAV